MNLMEYLKKRGVTKRHIAKICGISMNHLLNILKGKAFPSYEVIMKIERETSSRDPVTLKDWQNQEKEMYSEKKKNIEKKMEKKREND